MKEKIEIANRIAESIKAVKGVATACVDDYNKYGDFQVVAILELDDNRKPVNRDFSMRKIRAGIEKVLKMNEKVISRFNKNIDTPKRVYTKYSYRNFSESYFQGYEKDYVMIDFVVV
jgi:uncharacterized protein YifE (UPF0438 family)